jgi:uncharacterized membrane protein
MNWFLIALLPPALWSVTNHIDKYLLGKYIKGGGVGALMIFSAMIGFFILPIIYIFNPAVLGIGITRALLITINGAFYILAALPYFYALQKDEASVVVPLYQLIPVISYALAYLVLGETLNSLQIIGGMFIVLGAIGITLELSKGEKIKIKSQVFWLMLLSSFLFSINFTFFKYFALDLDFWTTSFWEYSGFAISAVLMGVLVKSYRKEFLNLMKNNKIPILGLNGFNETVNIVAKLSFNFASLLAPVTLIWVVNGFQPLFVFVYGVLLTLFFPHISKESVSKRHLLQKITAIILMFFGSFLLK